MGKSSYKRFACMGPGGRKCACCYPAPGPFRRREERKYKKREIRTMIQEELKLLLEKE